jgi:hypothetical protein
MKTMKMIWADGGLDFRNPCAACGRAIKEGSERWFVHVIDGGANVLHPDDEPNYEPDSGNMDFHAVGPECRKKFKDFAVKA